MPVYNEQSSLDDILDRVLAAPLPAGMELEVIAVNDRSTDRSQVILERRAANDSRIKVFCHEQNMGKGAAVRSAIKYATGDIAIIQDADLEYDPREYSKMIRPILENDADVVYGSRFASPEYRRVLLFWHTVANGWLTTLSNMLTDLNLTDMETGYKAFRMAILKTIPLRSNRFGIEPEITAKIAKLRLRVFETSVSYNGRTYLEGKKIGLKDAVAAVWTMFKFAVLDDLYEERYGAAMLHNIAQARRFTDWSMQRVRPYLSGVVLEVGAGIGSNVRAMLDQERVIATEPDPEYVALLRNAFRNRRRIEIVQWDATQQPPAQLAGVDTVFCSNVLEHIRDEKAALSNMGKVLKPGGRLIMVVPAGEALFGSMDVVLGHCRRYNLSSLLGRLSDAGFELEKSFSMNKIGIIGWWVNGKVFRRKGIGRYQLKLFNAMVPIFKMLDLLLPWTGLSLVVVAKKRA